MKYLLLLLIAFNVQAKWRVEVSTPRGNTFKEGMTSQECQDWLDDNQKKLKGHKHHDSFGIADRWLDNNDKPGFINSRIIESKDSEGNPIFKTEYFYPANYTVGAIEDITTELQTAETAKLNKLNGLKGKLRALGLSDDEIEIIMR